MASTKEIQRRIKSVSNTKKITKAMEVVSAAKMRRATESVLRTRSYANLSWTTILSLIKDVNYNRLHPLLTLKKEIKKVAIVLISSDRGLCGGFNSALMNKVQYSIELHGKNSKGEEVEHEFVMVGKKGLAIHNRYGYKVIANFPKVDNSSEIKDVSPISSMVVDEFLKNNYDKILVAYTDFVSPGKQVPRVKQLLPIDIDAEDDHLGIVGRNQKLATSKKMIAEKEAEYLKDNGNKYVLTYEPSASKILDEMIPRLIEVQLFQALLESNASEHSARMAAMHKANEAAGELVKELTLFYNKARQASITAEIAEISAGAAALQNN